MVLFRRPLLSRSAIAKSVQLIISIIIPTFNRGNQLTSTLSSLAKQDWNIPAEVIVVDNGSTDDTKTVVEQFEKQIPNLIYRYDAMPGLLTGRHHGAAIARGEILCFLDDDVILNQEYLKNLAETFLNDKNLHLATGPCLPNYEDEPPQWLAHFWQQRHAGQYCGWLSLLDFGNSEIEIDPNFVWGLNFCIRKKTLIDLGGFHPDCIPDRLQQYQGDGETGLTLKAIEKGLKAKYIPGLMLYHHVSKQRLTMEYFKKRAFYQGVCNSYTELRKQPSKTSIKPTSFRNCIHQYYRWIKRLLVVQPTNKNISPEIKAIIDNLATAEKSGYHFHQTHFSRKAEVRKWVLKNDYWDYQLPST